MVSFLYIIVFVGFLNDTPFTCMTPEYKQSNTLANNFCTLSNNYCYYALVLHQSLCSSMDEYFPDVGEV